LFAAWALDKLIGDIQRWFPPGTGNVADSIERQRQTHLEAWFLDQVAYDDLRRVESALAEYEQELKSLEPKALKDPAFVPGYLDRIAELRQEVRSALGNQGAEPADAGT
jgi:hypothetical protein